MYRAHCHICLRCRIPRYMPGPPSLRLFRLVASICHQLMMLLLLMRGHLPLVHRGNRQKQGLPGVH